jgi:hypothetical protein
VIELTTAVIAAVVGATTAVLVQLLQRSHTDRHRFTDLKRERYSTFLRDMDMQRRQIRHQRNVLDQLEAPVDPSDVPNVERPESMKLLVQEIVLLAPASSGVGQSAKQCIEALRTLRRYRFEASNPPSFLHEAASLDGFEAAVHQLGRSLDDFTERAKRDLGAT